MFVVCKNAGESYLPIIYDEKRIKLERFFRKNGYLKNDKYGYFYRKDESDPYFYTIHRVESLKDYKMEELK